MNTQSLYALSTVYAMLATAEDGPAFEEALGQLQDAIEVKADGVARVLRMYEQGSAAIQGEIDRLADLKAQRDRRAKALREYLLDCLLRAELPKLETPLFRFAIRQNPPVVQVTDPDALAAEFWRVVPETREVDRKAILEATKGGADVAGVTITRGRRIEIR